MSHHLIQFRYDGDRPIITPTGMEEPDLERVMRDAASILQDIADRRNYFYTLASVSSWKKREFERARYIGFDIDPVSKDEQALSLESAKLLAHIACEAAELDYDSTGVVLTGHGIQLIIELDNEVTDKRFYAVNKAVYDGLCTKIDAELAGRGWGYRTDRVVFDPARLFRLPGTINAKPGRPEVEAIIIQDILRPQPIAFSYDYENTLAFRMPDSLEWMNADTHARTKHLTDVPTILRECAFLVDNQANATTLREPRWYREAGILAFVPDGDRIFHERSRPHPDYSQLSAQAKLEQVRARQTGPVSCQTVNACWGGCQACPHYGRVKYPVHIQPPNIIPTEQWGFYKVTMHEGMIKHAVVQPDDLARKFEQDHPFRTISKRRIYAWQGTHYAIINDEDLDGYAEKKLKNPRGLSSSSHDRGECVKKIIARNKCPQQWITNSTHGKINLQNGVLDLRTATLSPHSMDYAFTSTLDYAFDPNAAAPTFEKFINDVMADREPLVKSLLEFIAYCISFEKPWLQKAAFFYGPLASNGKSTVVWMITDLLGEENVSNVELQDFKNPNAVVQMVGKAVNFSRECSPDALERSEAFKKLVTGEPISVRTLYENLSSISINAKQILLGNDFPKSSDKTRGLTRRLLPWPFDVQFTGPNRDKFMREKLQAERPGILNILLRSYAALKNRGYIEESDSQIELLKQYERENDNTIQWTEDRTQWFPEGDPKYLLSAYQKQALYDDYVEYCKRNGTTHANQVNFWKRIRRQHPDLDKRMFQAHGTSRKVRGVALLEKE